MKVGGRGVGDKKEVFCKVMLLMEIGGQKEGHLFGAYEEPIDISSPLLGFLSHIYTSPDLQSPQKPIK